MMKFAFEYTDTFQGYTALEISEASDWGMWWDYERNGEITILRIDMTTDDWETSCLVYEREA